MKSSLMQVKKETDTTIHKTHQESEPIKKKGLGTFDNDCPPVQECFGRESKQIRLEVCSGATIEQIQPKIERTGSHQY